ncbi:MAG TPA: phosphoribosyltransferase family protein [Anaerolineae bacterium]|jgi:orotate phosphoribosyltransferase
MLNTNQAATKIEQTVREAVAARRGHFRYESGHHGDLWLDLDGLFVDARRVRDLASALAEQVRICRPELVCGPLTGGAFIAQLVAAEIGVGFVFAERLVLEAGSVQYRLPEPLRPAVSGRRVLLVDDAVNAGSAVLLTLADLLACSAELAGFASLLTLGDAAAHIAQPYGVPFFKLVSLERGLWLTEECPLCSAGVPLIDPHAKDPKGFQNP